jgi:hypothetical protein
MSLAFGSLPLPSSAAGFAIGVRDWFHSKRHCVAPAMSVAATDWRWDA